IINRAVFYLFARKYPCFFHREDFVFSGLYRLSHTARLLLLLFSALRINRHSNLSAAVLKQQALGYNHPGFDLRRTDFDH
ncbi:hypothetical protein, partial [Klebsiella pneumoniae]|uniref:hypothetical protein n=1 Tax=Klebsiella pneumoniae TaxID=573 RepID=UPI001CDC57AB